MLLTKSRLSLLRAVAAGTCSLVLGGCGTAYLAQAAGGQLAVMRAREPIDKLLASPDTGAPRREQLVRAKRIRDFAVTELALPDNAAYRSYADIDRPYVVWNVVAAPELSVAPRQWCFPIAGCVAYRGYFSEEKARAFAAELAAKGDDVTVGGVPAYSTLGRTADPLLSTVNRYAEIDLAALIFHELAHQVVYQPGDSAFNEAFATAVEEEGVARYVAEHLAPADLARWQQLRRDRRALADMFAAARGDLAKVYESKASDEDKRAQKAERLAKLAEDLRAAEARLGRSTGYRAWLEEGLNNAHLAAVATYYEQVPRFERMLREQCGGYLPCLYVEAERAAQSSNQAKKKGRDTVGGEVVAAP